MPTYEYICAKCDHSFDFFQSMASDPLAICPKELCPKKRWGKGKVKRTIGGGAGLIFRGSGFHITDYRSESYKEAAQKDKPASADSGDAKKSSDSKSSEKKPKETKAKS